MAEDKPGSRSPRSVGDIFGDLARRVGEIVTEVSETVSMPEEIRHALEAARELRFAREWAQAAQELALVRENHPDDESLIASVALCWTHASFFGADDEDETPHFDCPPGDDIAACHLLAAARHLDGDPQKCLDQLRRSSRSVAKTPASERDELRLMGHLLASAAYAADGDRDRAIREAFKARSKLPPTGARHITRHLQTSGAIMLAAEDRLLEAERWVREAEPALAEGQDEDPTPETLSLLARIAAARGDRSATDGLVQMIPEGRLDLPTRIRIGLGVGAPLETRELALRHLREKPEDPERLRLWALAEARTWSDRIDSSTARGVIEALRAASEAAPRRLRVAHAQELASVALRADLLDPAVLETELALAAADGAPPEARILALRSRIRRREDVSDAFDLGPPVRLLTHSDLDKPIGPDELSPLRDPRRRGLAAQRALCIAEFCLQSNRREQAERALVEALIEMPQLSRAAELMQALTPQPGSSRLEDTLAAATALLAAVPSSVLGIPLEQIPQALSNVIAARERLARPLTIAIMGEFSSGKSTFVNALLGEDVAPTGALPTTSTINVFRHGAGGRARVHYRDDRIATLEREQVHPFLHGLDTTEASRIRFVEIERAGSRLGDTAVVDTPGLNALDPFHEKVARDFIEEADAVVWIFSATRSGAASEAAMLRELREGGRQVLGILNKVDTLDASEQQELADYLEAQLGEVLVGVVPLSATRALAWRTGGEREGADPFSAVDEALERNFLTRARELKRELTSRRFREALDLARSEVAKAVETLEARAARPDLADDTGRGSRALDALAEEVHAGVLDLDDLLVRECLAIGVLSVDGGFAARALDPQDTAYLDGALEEATLRVLHATIARVPTDVGPTLPTLVEERFVPWARGYLASRTNSRVDIDLGSGAAEAGPSLMAELLRKHGRSIEQGETALREGLRSGLRRVSDDFRRELRGLHRELEWASFFARQKATSAPRAEALRLRASVLAGIDALTRREVEHAKAGDRQIDPVA